MCSGQEQLVSEVQKLVECGDSVLIIGSEGVGKTHIMDYLHRIFPDSVFVEGLLLSASNIPGEAEMLLEKKLQSFNMWFIDDIDLLCGKDIDFRDALRFNVKSYFMRKFYPLGICIATCTDIKNIHEAILGKFKHQCRIVVSKTEQRHAIATNLLKEYPYLPYQELFVELAKAKFGAMPKDFDDILQKMAAHHLSGIGLHESAIREWFDFRPRALLPYLSDVPKYDLNSLYGVEVEKELLKSSLIDPFLHFELYSKHGLSAPKGIVLYGPSGSGKTHLGISMVQHAGLNLLLIDSTTIRSKYIGETEKRLQNVFQSARECAPCVLFFDRLECLMSERTKESSGSARLVSCFLTELDGIGNKSDIDNGMVIVMGTVERLEQLDRAIIRPGRLGVHLALKSLSRDAKISLYKEYWLKGYRLEDDELAELIEKTEGFSGAKLRKIFRDAAYHALRLNKEAVEYTDFKLS